MVTEAVTLRPLEEHDLEFLCEVRHHPQTLPHLHDPRTFSLEEAREWFFERAPQWLVVEAASARVGYVRISDMDRPRGTLKVGMDVHPSYRRKGIATSAYECLFRRLRREGWKRVWLEVLADNLAARALYEKLGFDYDPRRQRVVQRGETELESLAMSKVL